ncbi:hypothetical protein SMG44B_30394 [Stenotrophomonas maltophilia]
MKEQSTNSRLYRARWRLMNSSHDQLSSNRLNPSPLQAYRQHSPSGARRCRHVNSAAAA